MIVVLAGPIKVWWSEWGSERHKEYLEWRETLSEALEADGHLVYRPHEAFKGHWDNNDGDAIAQVANDAAIRASHVVINMTPLGVPSPGTDKEMALCERIAKPVVWAPPCWCSGSMFICAELTVGKVNQIGKR